MYRYLAALLIIAEPLPGIWTEILLVSIFSGRLCPVIHVIDVVDDEITAHETPLKLTDIPPVVW